MSTLEEAASRSLVRAARRTFERVTGFRIIWTRPWGLEIAADFRQSLPTFPVRTVFDVGANVGQSAADFALHWPDAEIHSFEPATDLFEALVKNVGKIPTITPHQIAFDAKPREDLAFVVDGVLSHLQRPGEELGGKSVERIAVQSLDQFCSVQNIDSIDFLKIDTEGKDLDVLKGARTLLEDQKIGVVQVEAGLNPTNTTHVPFEKIKAFMEAQGYYLFGIYDQVHEWSGHPITRRCNPAFISPRLWQNLRWRHVE